MLMMALLGLSGGDVEFLVNDMGLGTASSTQSGALAELTLTVLTDGTWQFTVGAGDTLGGSPTSGSWLQSGGTASNYEVRFTTSNLQNSPTVTNGASAFTAISANRAIKVEKTADNASADVLVEIRKINGPMRTLTDSVTMNANGA